MARYIAVEPVEGLPELPPLGAGKAGLAGSRPVETVRVPVLVIGGGPAGLSAGIELGTRGIETLIIDDKHRLGGKLVLQTHRFFGSIDAVYAGTRGIDIATRLESEVRSFPSVRIWLQSAALAVFSDRVVGVLVEGRRYVQVVPDILLVTAGAREKNLAFPGNTLPGVYGAGAFQTLVNRDLVRCAERLFIVGGGNVGLIAGYHAIQAGIEVVALIEGMPRVGGYKVHAMARAEFRFYEELNDFLAPERRKRDFYYECARAATVKNAIEALGVPHTEIDLILVNGQPAEFNQRIKAHDHLSVYPAFARLDISPPDHLQPPPLSPPRFVLDCHLGRLAAYLRLLGFDTLYRNNYHDAELAAISAKEERILLTCDRQLLMRREITRGYFVRSRQPHTQLPEVIQR